VAIRLSSALDAEIRAHAARDYPFECCGALLGKVENGVKIVTTLRPMENVHEEGHERRFRIDSKTVFQLMREERAGGPAVLGFYHSHPDHPARPSAYDREWASPWYSYIIVAVSNGEPREMTCWTLDDDGQAFQEESTDYTD